MQISKVKQIQGAGTWKELFKQEVTMEDGTTLTAFSKTQKPPYNIGDEVEYEVTRENQHGKSGKVKKNTPRPEGWFDKDDKGSPQPSTRHSDYGKDPKQLMIVRQSALKAAVEVAVNGDEQFNPLQITGLAEYFFNYCISGNVVVYLPALDGEAYTNDQVQEMMYEEEQKQKAVEETDDLPF